MKYVTVYAHEQSVALQPKEVSQKACVMHGCTYLQYNHNRGGPASLISPTAMVSGACKRQAGYSEEIQCWAKLLMFDIVTPLYDIFENAIIASPASVAQ